MTTGSGAYGETPSKDIVFEGAAGGALARPATLELSADGTLEVSKVTWTAWGGAEATGTGIAEYHGCTPSCAASPAHTAPVRIELSDITQCQQGQLFYNTVTLLQTDGVALDPSFLTTQNWAPCRSS